MHTICQAIAIQVAIALLVTDAHRLHIVVVVVVVVLWRVGLRDCVGGCGAVSEWACEVGDLSSEEGRFLEFLVFEGAILHNLDS